MNSDPLPPASSDADPLDAWLRQSAPPPLADRGFSHRVLTALPPRATVPLWRRWAPGALGTAAGLAVVLLHHSDRASVGALLASAANLADQGVDLALQPGSDLLAAGVLALVFLALNPGADAAG